MSVQTMSAASVPKTAAGPIAAGERIPEIDILRGFALFGILLVNMGAFAHSFYDYIVLTPAPGFSPDQIASFLIAFLGEGKFYSLFSFLFGFGLAIQMARAEARGVHFVPMYLRRLLVLLVIGLIHAYLIWVGDILAPYAVLGFLLLLFRKSRLRTLLIWSITMLALITMINLGLVGLSLWGGSTPEGAQMMAQSTQESIANFQRADEQATLVYSTGTFSEITAQRARDLSFIYPVTLFILPNIFAMFLLGLAAGKTGIFNHISANLPLFRKLQVWGLVVGVLGNLLFAIGGRFSSPFTPTIVSFLASFGQTVGAPMLSAFYLSTIVLLAQDPVWRKRLMVIAPLGRMALSNYLFQSLVCTTIFYSYGLALYGKVGDAAGILLTIAIYLIQIPLSHWWMKRFQFGPVEWLWRTLTYGRAPKMKKQTA